MNIKLKITKYIFFIILVSMGLIFNGELFKLYMDDFQESFYQCSFSIESSDDKELNQKAIEDFTKSGDKNNVDFFMVKSEINTLDEIDIVIYGTKGAIKELEADGIHQGDFKSLFLGTEKIRLLEFKEMDDISSYEDCYFIGDENDLENMREFKSELVDNYGGGFPKLMGSTSENWINLLSVWSIIFILALLISWYEVTSQKKEVAVRIILGEDLRKIFVKNAVTDTVVFVVLFAVLVLSFSLITYTLFKLSFMILMLCVFLIFNILVDGFILIVDFRKNLGSGSDGNAFIKVNYVIKTIVTIMVVIALSGNVMLVKQGIDYYVQKDFFKEHEDYSMYEYSYKIDNKLEKTEEDDNKLYIDFYKEFGKDALKFSDFSTDINQTYPTIDINENYFNEISSQNDELIRKYRKREDDKPCIFIPEGISETSFEYETALEIFDFRDSEERQRTLSEIKEAVSIIRYSEDVYVVAMDYKGSNYDSSKYHNPIIIVDDSISPEAIDSVGFNMMYKLKPKEFEKFISEHQLNDQIKIETNVWEMYQDNWNKKFRSLKLGLVLMVFLLFMECALIAIILAMEYRLNAVEMALKKVLGYRLIERNKHILKNTILGTIVGLVAALITCRILEAGSQLYMYLIVSSVFLLCVEIVFVLVKALRIERETITTILKGEKL